MSRKTVAVTLLFVAMLTISLALNVWEYARIRTLIAEQPVAFIFSVIILFVFVTVVSRRGLK